MWYRLMLSTLLCLPAMGDTLTFTEELHACYQCEDDTYLSWPGLPSGDYILDSVSIHWVTTGTASWGYQPEEGFVPGPDDWISLSAGAWVYLGSYLSPMWLDYGSAVRYGPDLSDGITLVGHDEGSFAGDTIPEYVTFGFGVSPGSNFQTYPPYPSASMRAVLDVVYVYHLNGAWPPEYPILTPEPGTLVPVAVGLMAGVALLTCRLRKGASTSPSLSQTDAVTQPLVVVVPRGCHPRASTGCRSWHHEGRSPRL